MSMASQQPAAQQLSMWMLQQQQQQQPAQPVTPPSSGESVGGLQYVTLQTHTPSSEASADDSRVDSLSSTEQAALQSKQLAALIAQAQNSRRTFPGNQPQPQPGSLSLQQQLKVLSLDGPQAAPQAPAFRSHAILSESAGLGNGIFWPQQQPQAPASAGHAYQALGNLMAAGQNMGISQNPSSMSAVANGTVPSKSDAVVDLRHLAPSLSSPTLALINNAANRSSPPHGAPVQPASNQAQQQPQQSAADQLLSQLANAGQQAERLRAMNSAGLMNNQLLMSQPGSTLAGSVQLVMDNADQEQALAMALASVQGGGLGSLDMGSNNSVSQLLAQNGDNTAAITPTVTSTAGGTTVTNSASLYVKNLSPDADELYLYQKFAPHGALLSCKVKTDPATGKCRGVGFVNYVDQNAALRAMQQLHGTRTPEGRQLHITLQAPRAVRAAAAAAAATQNVSPRSETTIDPGSNGHFSSLNGQTLPLSSQTATLGSQNGILSNQTVSLGSQNAVGLGSGLTLGNQTVSLGNNHPQTLTLRNEQGHTLTLNGQGMPLGAQTVSLNGSVYTVTPQLQFSMRPQNGM